MLTVQTLDPNCLDLGGEACAPPGFEDPRFRQLLAPEDWTRLSDEVRARFSHTVLSGEACIYNGRIIAMRISPVGAALATLCRLIGGALPIGCDEGSAATVAVTADLQGGGQVWTRLYARKGGFPRVIHSAKRFAGPTGLEEHVGGGVGMTLRVSAEAEGLVFTSERFFLTVVGRRVYLPRWLAPGVLTVRHRPLGRHRFSFELGLRHPVFGELVHQTCIFEEIGS